MVAATAAEALRLARESDPDLVLLDLGLPDGDGRDVCRALRRESDVPIVMVTARGTETDRIVGLELGADDYVVKPFSAAEVAARIRAVLRRSGARRRRRPHRASSGLEIDTDARRVFLDGEEVELTRKEFDLLARLARDPGQRRHPRGPDVRRVGRQLVRLDQDARRPHRAGCAASSATTLPTRASSTPCAAWASAWRRSEE